MAYDELVFIPVFSSVLEVSSLKTPDVKVVSLHNEGGRGKIFDTGGCERGPLRQRMRQIGTCRPLFSKNDSSVQDPKTTTTCISQSNSGSGCGALGSEDAANVKTHNKETCFLHFFTGFCRRKFESVSARSTDESVGKVLYHC